MSSTVLSSLAASFSASPIPTSTDSGNNNNNNNGNNSSNNPNTFYRNLFYILIGLLVAFGLISFLSLFRARHRRLRIAAEATRLGLLVPGMDGYIPLRERRNLRDEARWRKSDGRVLPDWWDVEKVLEIESGDEKTDAGRANAGHGIGTRTGTGGGADAGLSMIRDAQAIPLIGLAPSLAPHPHHTSQITDFRPLAIIPPSISLPLPQAPRSDLSYFPHHLAYRPEDLDPLPTKFGKASVDTNLHDLAGERIEVVTMIKMPGEAPRTVGDVEEGEEVLNEWGGICVGVLRVAVEGDRARGGVI